MILEVKNGCFSYNSRSILSDISFELEEHKVMTVLGPNGVEIGRASCRERVSSPV